MSTSHASVISACKDIDFHITHYTYDSYTDWIDKIIFIAHKVLKQCTSKELKNQIYDQSLIHYLLFLKINYKGGIFQGIDGFTVALTTMFNTYMKYIKLNELHDNNIDPKKHFPKSK